MFFSRFFIAIIVTELARKYLKTVLFCQNGQPCGNSTLFELEGVNPRSQNFGQKSYNVALDTLQNSSWQL